MDKVETSRRSLLGAIAIAASVAVLASQCAPQPAHAAPVDRAKWDCAMRKCLAAKHAVEDDDKLHASIMQAFEREAPSYEQIDFSAFPFADRKAVAHTLDLDVRWERFLACEGRSWFPEPSSRDAVIARHKASFDSVRAYRSQRAALDRRLGVSAAADRNDALNDAYTAAIDDLIEMPAPDGPALLWKLEYLLDCGTSGWSPGWNDDYVQQALADARRLLGETR